MARQDASDRSGIFAGDDPFDLARAWLSEAEAVEPNDPNAMALATVDASGLPNARIVLLKSIEGNGQAGAFVFYTNYVSAKARELDGAGSAAIVMHWKSLRRQIRARGFVTREEGPTADAYFASRSSRSRLGAWASRQSEPLATRADLLDEVERVTARLGTDPPRPSFWGGYRLDPVEMEFWADGEARLHDRFRWSRENTNAQWGVTRLSP